METGENKTMYAVILALLLLFSASVFFYNRTLNELAAGSCTDAACPHEKIVETQNIIIAALILAIGALALWIFFQIRKSEKAAYGKAGGKEGRQGHQPSYALRNKNLDLPEEERKILSFIESKQGSVFQSEIVKFTGFTKVKVSRILDRMEQKGIIERKRRGMANLVVLR